MAFITFNKETKQMGSFTNLSRLCSEVSELSLSKMQYLFSNKKERDVQIGVLRIVRVENNTIQTQEEVKNG